MESFALARNATLLACAAWLLAACGASPSPGDAKGTAAPSTAPTAPPATAGQDRAQRCDAALRALEQEHARLSSCTTDPECGKAVSTRGSCGCTHDAVVRLDADVTKYEALLAEIRGYADVPACMPLVGTCDCPAMDGFLCADGRCRWKPLDRSTLCERTVTEYVGTRVRACDPPGPKPCPATLTLRDASAVLVREGQTLRGNYQCSDGVLDVKGDLVARADVGADGSVTLLDDVFEPTPTAEPEPQPAPVTFTGQQSSFMPPSGDINCIYTAAGGTGIYVPTDGGPELSCDRSAGKSYQRVYLGKAGPAQIVPRPGDASCCAVEPIVPEGGRVVRGPFTCELSLGDLTCKRDDGHGFVLGRKGARVFSK